MKAKKKAIFMCAAIICAMHVYNSLRVKHNLLKCALVHPKISPLVKLLSCGDEGSFITLTGMNFESFRILVSANFSFDELSRNLRIGRPSVLGPNGRLGLALFFFSSRIRIKHLCMIFGFTSFV